MDPILTAGLHGRLYWIHLVMDGEMKTKACRRANSSGSMLADCLERVIVMLTERKVPAAACTRHLWEWSIATRPALAFQAGHDNEVSSWQLD
ncbi:MAG: hypothetical protein RL030_1874 [Pseudomonadota bacterium]